MEQLDALWQEMKENIKEFGWHGIWVAPDVPRHSSRRKTGDEEAVAAPWPFEYTIGLWETFQHPELVVVGLPQTVSHGILHNIVDLHIRDGAGVVVGPEYDGILQHGFKIAFRQVRQKEIVEHCCWADAYYERTVFPVLQVVFPDKMGRFPWDDGYAMRQVLWT